MAPPLDIHKLLKEPFGPYHEEKILGDKFSKGDLTSVTFECAGSPIGCVRLAPISEQLMTHETG